jgi:hypothetical protein
VLIPEYKKTEWIDNGPEYNQDNFNNFENQIKKLSKYDSYHQKQVYLMG